VTRHSLALVVGSTSWKPSIIDGNVEPREILNLTIIFDHNVVDGAPAVRFTKRLIELIERGFELDAIDNQGMSSSIIEEGEDGEASQDLEYHVLERL
jgi:hypothetical protein